MRAAALACLLLLCTPLPLPAADVPEWIRVFSQPVLARALLGVTVKDAQGGRAGTVEDLVFDLEHNRVHHVLVGSRAYPMHALKAAPGGLVLDLPDEPVEQRWQGPRLFSAKQLFASGKALDAVLDAFWGSVAFAVIEAAGALRPVPLDAFHEADGSVRLRLEPGALRSIDGFTRDELEARLQDRDFLQRHARLAHQLTPLR